MKTQKNQLIDSLLFAAKKASDQAMRFRQLDPEILSQKPSPDGWSILECIEHLNLYGEFYLPEIERRLLIAAPCHKAEFRSGLIGNYFITLVTAKEGQIRRMKTPPNKNPNNAELNIITIDRFLKQQEMLCSLLERSRKISLTNTKTNIALMPVLKLRLGDTFRFLSSHTERHLLQAKALL